MTRSRWFLLVLLAAKPAWAETQKDNAAMIFAQHDPESRMPNTIVEGLGTLSVGRSTFDIYYLNFTNPVSRHGQQRIAIIKNGREFAGAFQCTLGTGRYDGSFSIVANRIEVTLNDSSGSAFQIVFDEDGPTKNRYFCGEGSGWENGV